MARSQPAAPKRDMADEIERLTRDLAVAERVLEYAEPTSEMYEMAEAAIAAEVDK